MKFKFTQILHFGAVLFAAALAFSCKAVYEGGDACAGMVDGESYLARIIFHTIDGNNDTKVLDEDLIRGLGRENFLDRNRTHFLIFTNSAASAGDNTFLAEMQNEKIAPKDNTNYPDIWDLYAPISEPLKDSKGNVIGQGPLTVEQLAAGFKLVVLSNIPDTDWDNFKAKLDEDYTVRELCADLAYNFTRFASPTQVCIPMYGVLNVAKDTKFVHNIATYVGQIDMLRAMSKIELVCESEDDEITDAYIVNGYNAKGKACPIDIFDEVEKSGSKWSEKTLATHTLNIPDQTPATADLQFYRSEADGTVWVCYVPEFDIVGAEEDKRPEISVKGIFSGEDEAEYTVRFCEYDEDGLVPETPSYFNLVRNYHYRYNLKKSALGNLVVKVDPWNRWTSQISTQSHEGAFNFMAWGANATDPFNKNGGSPNADYFASGAVMRDLEFPQLNTTLGKPVAASYTRGGIKVECSKSAARFSFKITAPAGVIWTANLTNGEDFDFLTSDGIVDGRNPVMQGTSRGDAFEIAVVPNKELFVGDEYHDGEGTHIVDENYRRETHLYITVLYATSTEYADYLQINPEGTAIWPFGVTTEDAYTVLIRQKPIQAN
ncbi:MAG: hypothetical protein HUJ89_07190 [Bacteroidales bacterium]|nr:hypothetical protein [Bacteroidales bacterium]